MASFELMDSPYILVQTERLDTCLHVYPAATLQSVQPFLLPLSHYSYIVFILSPQTLLHTEVCLTFPVQAYPSSTKQFVHPVLFPLSHYSAILLIESPQTLGTQVEAYPTFPTQLYNGLTVQNGQPAFLPLSHYSALDLILSPQIDMQVDGFPEQ